MNTLNKYISTQFLLTFFMALVVLSFVMSVGLIFKAVSLISRGASLEIVWKFIWGGFPFTLSYSIPISLLICSLLVFGRLSSDSEIMAMRACGVSLFNIMRMPLLLALFFSIFCLYLNNNISPESSFSRKTNRNAIGVNEVAALIEPGKNITSEEFGGGVSIYVGERDGKHLTDIRIVEPLENEARRVIEAKRAIMTAEENNSILRINLFDVVINTFSASGTKDMTSVVASSLPFELSIVEEGDKNKEIKRRPKDKPSWQLVGDIELYDMFESENKDLDKRKTYIRSKVELYSRYALAFSCFCFVLIGIPLGIKQHRKESAIGLSLSFVVAGFFYLFAILGQSLSKNETEFADIAHFVVIIPVFICIGLGAFLIKRGN